MSDAPWLTQRDICLRFGISDETWRRWVRAGIAPAPLPDFPKNRPRWGKHTIDAWDHEQRGIVKAPRSFFGSHRRSA